jgi:hypothetical protein
MVAASLKTLTKSVKRLHKLKKGIDRLKIHTFWRNYVSKFKKKNRKGGGGIHASSACGPIRWKLYTVKFKLVDTLDNIALMESQLHFLYITDN